MGALSHDCRTRIEERTHLSERLAEMKAERRRISVDLRGERDPPLQEPIAFTGCSTRTNITRDTDKPAWAMYESDKICEYCGKEAQRDRNYPCRVCTRVFHPDCLRDSGKCRPADLKAATRALTNQGWSCFHCSNLSSLLSEEEIEELIEAFDEFDKDKDNQVTWEEYRDARGLGTGEQWSRGQGRRMSRMTETAVRLEFAMADQDEDSVLDWWEFLNLAAQHQLGKRTEEVLVNLLSEKEVIRIKAVFREMDKDGDGVATGLGARRAVRTWCSPLDAGLTPDAVAKISPTIDSHVEVRARMLVTGGDQQRDMITWPDFLAEQALYILCSRPNMAPHLMDKLHGGHNAAGESAAADTHTIKPASHLHNHHNEHHPHHHHNTTTVYNHHHHHQHQHHHHHSEAASTSHKMSESVDKHHREKNLTSHKIPPSHTHGDDLKDQHH
ncbi:hypothetical protein ACOMHN_014950 [Nucella lapillus]